MAAVFTIADRPAGYDQTQKKFSLSGTTAFSGTYTAGTGFAFNFATGTLQSDGSKYILPPTYTGAKGPGHGVPTRVEVASVAGYIINYVDGVFFIFTTAGTELETGTVPTDISDAGVPTVATFLRG